mmetsp:Transcript_81989/g.254507  ORF Transcript_81989/g.254507 Transcript_81989/m.254507 type:complete len:250 (-) Transcript_81989:265-1014(-)
MSPTSSKTNTCSEHAFAMQRACPWGAATATSYQRSDVAVPQERVRHALQNRHIRLIGVEHVHHEERRDVAQQQEVQDVGKCCNSILPEREHRRDDILEEIEAHQEGEKCQCGSFGMLGLHLHGRGVLLARHEDGPHRGDKGQDLRVLRCGAQDLEGELTAEGLREVEAPGDQLRPDRGEDGEHDYRADVLHVLLAQQWAVADDQGHRDTGEANNVLQVQVEDAWVPEEAEAQEEEAEVHEQHPSAKGAQ